jgi:glycosyltransferase involved in cell wall biosynthesis
MVIAEMGSGGAEAVVTELARGLVADGGRAAVASNGGWRVGALQDAGVRVVPLALRGRRHLLASRRALRNDLRARPADVIHAHNVKAALVARLASAGLPGVAPPVVATLHGLADRDYATAARVLRRCAARVVAVSQPVAEQVIAAGYPRARVELIENAITPLPMRDRDVARARLAVPPDALVAACVARLVPQKRHDLLVQAWLSMPDDAILLIAGDGPTRPQLEAAIHASGQRGRIRLLGERRDIDWLLAAADLCVLPTDWEGLPISLLEAMSAQLPVVASGVPQLVSTLDGAAELVEPGSARGLAHGIQRVFGNREYAAQLAAAGRRLVDSRYGVPRMRADYDRVYAQVCSTEGTSP